MIEGAAVPISAADVLAALHAQLAEKEAAEAAGAAATFAMTSSIADIPPGASLGGLRAQRDWAEYERCRAEWGDRPPVNTGAYDTIELERGDRAQAKLRRIERGEQSPDDVAINLDLEREPRDSYLGASLEYLMGAPTHCKGGGGGGNGSKKAAAKAKIEATSPQVDARETLSPTRFNVHGLTRGVQEYFHRQPGTAREILADCADEIDKSKKFPKRTRLERSSNTLRGFTVYGLSNRQIDILRVDPGLARYVLISYAVKKDAERIKARDGCLPKISEAA